MVSFTPNWMGCLFKLLRSFSGVKGDLQKMGFFSSIIIIIKFCNLVFGHSAVKRCMLYISIKASQLRWIPVEVIFNPSSEMHMFFQIA